MGATSYRDSVCRWRRCLGECVPLRIDLSRQVEHLWIIVYWTYQSSRAPFADGA